MLCPMKQPNSPITTVNFGTVGNLKDAKKKAADRGRSLSSLVREYFNRLPAKENG